MFAWSANDDDDDDDERRRSAELKQLGVQVSDSNGMNKENNKLLIYSSLLSILGLSKLKPKPKRPFKRVIDTRQTQIEFIRTVREASTSQHTSIAILEVEKVKRTMKAPKAESNNGG